MQQLSELYFEWCGSKPYDIQKMPGAGSNRQYYRLVDLQGNTVIGVVGTSHEENDAFIYLARHFRKRKLPVPEILAVSGDGMRYLQQDLGNTALFDVLKEGREAGGRYNLKEKKLLVDTIRQLPNFQIRGARELDWNYCYPQPEFDEENVLFDLNYFKYCFLKPTDLDFHELKLEANFRLLAKDLVAEPTDSFMYRDFQARNVMIDSDGKPSFIDFQGGRKGPYYYDLASFLWQASARYSNKLRRELIYEYYYSLKNYTEVPSKRHFVQRLSLFVLFRTLQVLGAYGFRGYFERKQHFIDSIPPAMENLRELLNNVSFPYPYLVDVLQRLANLPRFVINKQIVERADGYRITSSNVYDAHPADGPATFSKYDGKGPLVVRIYSFSYKKGIPEDESGNGGGYVFDCRSTHNPGRYEPYKKLTGLDEPVIRFLEDDGEILTFLESVYRLTDAHVARYIQRGFTSLMFSFGCTGGQHRSVYSAQHLAIHIHEKFGIEVHVVHREQGISEILEAKRQAAPMQAMVFAAGLGTRLKPLTDTMPKALVKVGDKTLLDRTLTTLQVAGAKRVVVNVHHFASQIIDHLERKDEKDMNVIVSDESEMLLDTGGGLRKAASLFNPDANILIHNVDILSNVNLKTFYEAAQTDDATLLVSKRQTSRYLLFDDDMRLVGWQNIATGEVKSPHSELDVSKCHRYAFAGIHVFSPRLFQRMEKWPEKFGIIDFYLRICDQCVIRGLYKPDLQLMDVGKADTLAQAETFLQTLSTAE